MADCSSREMKWSLYAVFSLLQMSNLLCTSVSQFNHLLVGLICYLIINGVLITVCREDIEKWEATGVLTKACVSFSRDSLPAGTPRYVQDNICLYGSHVARLIHDCNATVSRCIAQSINLRLIAAWQNASQRYTTGNTLYNDSSRVFDA